MDKEIYAYRKSIGYKVRGPRKPAPRDPHLKDSLLGPLRNSLFGGVCLLISRVKPFLTPFFQVPRDPEDPQGADRQKEEQRLIDESEPLNEEETAEKEQLLQEVATILSNG